MNNTDKLTPTQRIAMLNAIAERDHIIAEKDKEIAEHKREEVVKAAAAMGLSYGEFVRKYGGKNNGTAT